MYHFLQRARFHQSIVQVFKTTKRIHNTWRLRRFSPTLVVCFKQLRFCNNKLALWHLLHHQLLLLPHLHQVNHHLVLLQLQVRHRLGRKGWRRSLLSVAFLSFRSSQASWTWTLSPNRSQVHLQVYLSLVYIGFQTWRSLPSHCREGSLFWCCSWTSWHRWCCHWQPCVILCQNIIISGKVPPLTWRKRAVSMRGARSSCWIEISPL